jgi:hypothetical protein
MQPLETIKQKLMLKPQIKDIEPVVIAIKIEGENIETERQEQERNITNIVDESNKDYDRKGLLQKLLDNKITKVQKKPVLEQVKEKEIIEPITPVMNIPEQKKAKKIKQKKLLLVEDNETDILKPVPIEEENVGELQEVTFEKIEEPEPIAEMMPTEKKEPTRGRKTKKVEKGIAVLGSENAVEIGDTKLSDRLLKKSPPVLVKVSSYYMNNRELFVNFVNSLFEPYKKELEEMKSNISCDDIGKDEGDFSLLTHQKIVRDYMNLFTPYRGLLLYHGLGAGKCMKKGTPIIMSNGEIKLVEDIKVGDLLMGDDSTPRTVTSLARGRDKMYDIVPVKGEKYTVNQEHILCLRASGFPKLSCSNNKSNTNYNIQWLENNEFCSKTFTFNQTNQSEMKLNAEKFFENIKNNSKTNDNIFEIPVKDYLNLSDTKKSFLKGYKVPVDFPEQELPIDPYMIGYWLGDGTSRGASFTSQDSTVLYYFAKYCRVV